MKQLYYNGKVFTDKLPLVSAFAVEDDRFIASGTDEDILALYQEGDEKIDLEGKFVVAGFIDSHMHVVNYGSAMECCDLMSNTTSLAGLIDAMKQFISDNNIPAGQMVKGRGFNHDYFCDYDEIPTREELDKISTEHPVVIVRCCGHALAVNTYALKAYGLDGTQPQIDGGHYDVDENGYPTGVFRDAAMSYVYSKAPAVTKEAVKSMILTAQKLLNSYGVTSAHTDDLTSVAIGYEEVISAYKELESEGKLTVRIYEQSQVTEPEELKNFLAKGYNTGVGTNFFKIGPLKLLGDGSLGARTAYLAGEYADAPGEKGLAIFTQEQFDELIGIAHKAGMQVAIHAIGDGILDRILNSYEKAFSENPRKDHRSGIVHVQITRPDQLEKMKKLGLHAYIQSIFIDYDSHIVEARVGEKLAKSSYSFHTLRKMGVHVSNGTDCPVEMPIAMKGIQCAVTRQPINEDIPPYRPEEAMTVEEALQSYTTESAHAAFEENIKGAIRPGFLADFVILSQNPFEVAPNKLATIEPLKTFVGGKLVYEK